MMPHIFNSGKVKPSARANMYLNTGLQVPNVKTCMRPEPRSNKTVLVGFQHTVLGSKAYIRNLYIDSSFTLTSENPYFLFQRTRRCFRSSSKTL